MSIMKRFMSRFGVSNPTKLGVVSPMQRVPGTVSHPEYSLSGQPHPSPNEILTFKKDQLVDIRKSARLARKMLNFANSLVKPGISTDEIDRLTFEEIVKHGAYPSPINYCGFPKAICTSVNEVACHGIPDNRILCDGDIISIDVSIFMNGFHGDNCGTVIVGNGDENLVKLMNTTQLALDNAISVCKPGGCLSDIGGAIENTAAANDFRIVHEFCGHGTGPILHMKPLVLHYRNKERLTLKPGMVFTIEPILVEGSRRVSVWADGWTAATMDGGRAAQFEHEVLITEDGVEVLTVDE